MAKFTKFFVNTKTGKVETIGATKVTALDLRGNVLRVGSPTLPGTDANFLRVVREDEVTVVDNHFGSLITTPSGPPTCGAFIKNMTGISALFNATTLNPKLTFLLRAGPQPLQRALPRL